MFFAQRTTAAAINTHFPPAKQHKSLDTAPKIQPQQPPQQKGFTNSLPCSDLYRLYWFYIAFLLVVLVGLAVCAAGGWLLASALSWMAWLVALSVLLILASDSFLSLRDVSSRTTGGVWFSRAATAAAGFILSAIFSLGLAFLLGWRQRRSGAGGAAGVAPIKF